MSDRSQLPEAQTTHLKSRRRGSIGLHDYTSVVESLRSSSSNKEAQPKPRSSRRRFCKAASSVAGCLIVSPEILGRVGRAASPERVPPSDQFRFVQIGAGGRGRTDLTETIAAGGKPVAFCDVDVQRAGKTYELHPNLPRRSDFRKMLDEFDRECDAVVISTPDHIHGVQGLDALRRGKHLFLQKPLARTFDECDRLIRASHHAGVATQMGNQCQSGFAMVAWQTLVNAGLIGAISEVHCWTNRPTWPQGMTDYPPSANPPSTLQWDTWLGPVAKRPFARGYLPYAWRGWRDFGTGALGDMGCQWIAPAWKALKLSLPQRVTADVSDASTIS
ncbi:MAG: Gfo/Idh/MocA family oxidoreductase, partial [Planctomycetota bacterium]